MAKKNKKKAQSSERKSREPRKAKKKKKAGVANKAGGGKKSNGGKKMDGGKKAGRTASAAVLDATAPPTKRAHRIARIAMLASAALGMAGCATGEIFRTHRLSSDCTQTGDLVTTDARQRVVLSTDISDDSSVCRERFRTDVTVFPRRAVDGQIALGTRE